MYVYVFYFNSFLCNLLEICILILNFKNLLVLQLNLKRLWLIRNTSLNLYTIYTFYSK